MNITKNHYKIILTCYALYFLSLSTFQATTQHWSTITDQDIYVIYNSLLIASGFEQEYVDHPAFTTFFFLGFIFKIFSFFFDNFTIQEILLSKDIDKNLQNLFFIARILNSIYFCFLIFVFIKILELLRIRREICILSLSSILLFAGAYELLFLVRSEILSILLALTAFYFLLKFINNKKKLYNCLLSGFFFCLAMLAKIQVIFLIFIFFLILPFLFKYFECEINKNYLINDKKYYQVSLSILFIIFIGYLIFEFFFALPLLIDYVDPIISLPHYIDVILITLSIFFYSLLLIFLSKKKYINFCEITSTIFTIIIGFVFCLLLFLLLDLINLIKFNKTNILLLINPIHFMSQYASELYDPSTIKEYDLKETVVNFHALIKDSFYNVQRLPDQKYTIDIGGNPTSITDLFGFKFILISSFLILFFILNNNNTNILILLFLLLVGIFVTTFSFAFRYGLRYDFYLYPFFIILVSLALNQFRKKNVILVFFLIFTCFFSELFLLKDRYKSLFKRENRIYFLCNVENSKEYIEKTNQLLHASLFNSFLTQFTKFDNEFVLNYCSQMKMKLSWKTNINNIKSKTIDSINKS